MNRRQKEVLQNELRNERTVLNQINAVYQRAMIDIEAKIEKMQARINMNLEDTAAIYQKQFQEALKGQVSAILDNLNANQYDKIQDYLENCYYDSFIGVMYDLQGQGIPVIMPIDQEQAIRAIQHDTKLKKSLYESLGYNVNQLKRTISGEVSRGIANGFMHAEIARNIRNHGKVSMSKAYTIARTEGHRISEQSKADSRQKAKEAGADVLKQWDSTLDSRTRESHQKLDGQIRELDEPFEVNGRKAMHPGGFGIAKEDINCRCVTLQRARWALDEAELETLEKRAKYFGLDKTKDLKDFKEKYLKAIENMDENGKIKGNTWREFEHKRTFGTKKEAIDYFKSEHGIKFSDSRKYPIDEQIITECAAWHDKFNNAFEAFAEKNPCKIPVIKAKASSGMGNAVGYYQYYSRNDGVVELALNADYHRSVDTMKKYMEKAHNSKWQSTANVSHTFIHEYGHHVSNSMKWITGNKTFEHEFIKECIEEFKKQVPDYKYDTYVGIGEYVSRYGSTSESELFAEAFAEYFGEGEPRTFAKIFGEKLEERMKGV